MSVEQAQNPRSLEAMGPFERMLVAPSPAFICAGARKEGAVRLIRVSHRFNKPANEANLSMLENFSDPFGADLRQFYSASNGAKLFVGQHSDSVRGVAIALTLFPIEKWEEKRKLATKFKHPRFPIHSSLIVAEPPQSANLIALLTEGPEKGAVIYLDHEGDIRRLANSLGRFLDVLGKNPASLIYDLGCFTRYSDGQSDVQWIPRIYLENAEEQVAGFNRQLALLRSQGKSGF